MGADDQLDEDQQEVVADENRSIILGLISQLGKSMDLYRVTLPVFVLEPRSMLERITDFLSHPEAFTTLSKMPTQEERFLGVVRYFLSGWHHRPRGVKKPYNPILGEFFRCKYQFPDGTKGIYIAEQVSHHPPMSAYHFTSPENGITIYGELHPKSRFLGNSAATLMQGYSRLVLDLENGEREVYEMTLPNVYARGVVFGTMLLELGDKATICGSGWDADIEFKVKGFFTGTYNAIHGKVRYSKSGTPTHKDPVLYEITGKWNEKMFVKNLQKKGTQPELLFDTKSAISHPMIVDNEEDQELHESRRLWSEVTAAMKKKDLDAATLAKTKIEDDQRRANQERAVEGLDWQARFFQLKAKENEWHVRHDSE